MMPKEFFLQNLWRWKEGLQERSYNSPSNRCNINSLYASEWSKEFERLMRNRLVLGALRYGKMYHFSRGKNLNRCKSIRKRLKQYEKTGNAENLVDIANEALLMFEEKTHPNHHFMTEDDGYHTENH